MFFKGGIGAQESGFSRKAKYMFKALTKGSSEGGFTLIELLIVIGIIAILAAIVIVAVNPAHQFAQARNAQRQANVNAIVNAVHQNMVDNDGIFTGTIPGTTATISSDGTDICGDITPTYIAEMPFDPSSGSFSDCTDYNTGYTISSATAGRITVSAPQAELETTISVTQ